MEVVVAEGKLTERQIQERIEACPRLASLRTINNALRDLLDSDHSLTCDIAEVIRRDQSLTTRVLQLVNSVYYGLAAKVNNIEEAIFFLGLREVRTLAFATPVIEELSELSWGMDGNVWRTLWQHSIGTAILTRELFSAADPSAEGDMDYITGLLHDVGKVVMAHAFPESFRRVLEAKPRRVEEVCAIEEELIGWHHGRIGAYYLHRHHLSADVVDAISHHHFPEDATSSPKLTAAVQVADMMVRSLGLVGLEDTPTPSDKDWRGLPGWQILFGPGSSGEEPATLQRSLHRLPAMIEGLV